MPLRDHFHSPVNDKHRWDAVHGQWPGEIVRTLFDILPAGYLAEPQVYHGAPFEVDVSMIEDDDRPLTVEEGEGGTATLVAPPTLTVPADLSTLDDYEVRVYDIERERTLVAAIEIVSPANKDRPQTRDQFGLKVDALLREDVCVAIVDLVTSRQANLYAELLARLGHSDPSLGDSPPILYAATLRGRKPRKKHPVLDAWFFPFAVGRPLPTVPLWLSPNLHIALPLEPSYQETCRLLRIA
ncbi:MAG: DUF4058 family protein [Gemmataceae bacterium]|nr:DUF4058 family protein [Gemmataceae bacterium]